MDILKIIERLSMLCGPSGREETVAQEILKQVSPFSDETYMDGLYNVIAVKRSHDETAPTLMLDAHIDEVCMMIKEIDDDGFLKVSNIAGMDPCAMLAADVSVHGKEDLFGVICCKPPHLQTKEDTEKNVDIKDIVIDVGLPADEVRALLEVGDDVTWHSKFMELKNRAVIGKTLDDRVCAAIMIKCFEELTKVSLPFHVAALFSVQEEAGCRGAKVGAYTVSPDEAIVLDVSHAMVAGADQRECGELGKGPMIGIAPILDRTAFERLKKTAETKKIPFQVEVMTGNTGTNAYSVQTARSGIKTALVSVPLRFMHTPNERMDLDDIENTVRLLVLYLKNRGQIQRGTMK